ncbi:MAG: hypothetical protein J5585_01105 [Clostridia bacterium]|nr:hypothetical protein [Clostridia bacterium]
MRGKDLLEKIELADDKYIDEASAYKKKSGGRALRISLIAAAAALAVLLPVIFITVAKLGGGKTPGSPEFNDPVFTAKEIANKTSLNTLDGATKIYTNVYAPSLDGLNYNCLPVPESETVSIYERKIDRTANESEAKAFIDKYLPAVCKKLGVSANYEIRHRELTEYTDESYNVTISERNYYILASSNSTFDSISFLREYDEYTPVSLDGIKISVDIRQTDEEIISSLQPLRAVLCELFDVDLPDICISRSYADYTETDMDFFSVFIYDKTKNLMDIRSNIVSDCIKLYFRNYRQTSSSIVSDGVLNNASVYVNRYKKPADEICVKTAEARLISIEEAEELLRKGYVFGGHSCPICMASQQAVSFDEYDKVGLIYFNGIPFYAFYKDTGKAEYNDNRVYARTLVCAIEVSGYEEYFESQKAYHVK